MRPGDLVRRGRDGAVARVVRLEDEATTIVVEVDGEERRWGRSSVRVLSGTKPPRGLVKVTDKHLEAARLAASGMKWDAIAARYDVSRHTIATWLERVRAAAEEARHLAANE